MCYRLFQAEAAFWDHTTYVAQQGDFFSVTCTATDMSMFDIIRVSRQDPVTNDIDVVATWNSVEEPFRSTNRYNAIATFNRPQKTATLQLDYIGKWKYL